MRPRLPILVLAVTAVLMVTACGADTSEEPAAVPSGGASVPVEASEPASTTEPSPAPTPEPTSDALAACATFAGGGERSLMSRIPASLVGIGAEITQDQLHELLEIHSSMADAVEQAPPDLAAALTLLNRPFQTVRDVMDAGGGSLNMDTSNVMEDVTRVMGMCADAGYRIETAAETSADPDLTTDAGLCAADAEMTNLELNDALAPLLGFPPDRGARTLEQDDAIRAHKNAAFARGCPERAS